MPEISVALPSSSSAPKLKLKSPKTAMEVPLLKQSPSKKRAGTPNPKATANSERDQLLKKAEILRMKKRDEERLFGKIGKGGQ